MRRNLRSTPLFFLGLVLALCVLLILLSSSGLTAPIEGLAAEPLNGISGFFTQISLNITRFTSDLAQIQTQQQRIAELEEQLALLSSELIQLREIASDYQRLAGLLDYASTVENQQFVTADVISYDQRSTIRSIVINVGTRSGITVGMPVVTELGLVGRVVQVSANAARVQLINDQNSAVSGRLQTTRVEGSVRGQSGGTLLMQLIPLGADIIVGDLVITSGLGGNFPPNIVIGQVTSIRQFEFELFQEASVRSLIDFDTLEFVLVITSFQPVDLSVFGS